MAHQVFQVTPRTISGNSVRKLRRDGAIPAVVYGAKVKSSMSVSLSAQKFNKLYKVAGHTNVVELEVEGSKSKIPTLIHEIDHDPVLGTIRHVDFLAVDLKQKTEAEVPLTFIGESAKAKEESLLLNTLLDHVIVEALPDKIPSEIVVDLAWLDENDGVIHISHLPTTEDYSIINDPKETVLTLAEQKVEVEEEPVSGEVEIGENGEVITGTTEKPAENSNNDESA